MTLDQVEVAMDPVDDLTVVLTKQLAVSSPDTRFQRVLAHDLRQAPAEVLGAPFQNYLFLAGKFDGPTVPAIWRELRLLRAFYKVQCALPDDASLQVVEPGAGDPAEGAGDPAEETEQDPRQLLG